MSVISVGMEKRHFALEFVLAMAKAHVLLVDFRMAWSPPTWQSLLSLRNHQPLSEGENLFLQGFLQLRNISVHSSSCFLVTG